MFAVHRSMLATSGSVRRLSPVRLATRRQTRAHCALSRRPVLRDELNALAEACERGLSAALGAPVRLRTRWLDPPVFARRALGHDRVFCLLSLTALGAEAVLEVEPRLLAGLGARLTGAPVPTAPVLELTRLETSLAGHLLLSALAAARELGSAEQRWAPRLLRIVAERAEAELRLGSDPLLTVDVDIDTEGVRGRAQLYLPELAVRAVALREPPSLAARGGSLGVVSLQFVACAPCGSLWREEIATLAIGQALMLPGSRRLEDSVLGPVALARRGARLIGVVAAGGFELQLIRTSPVDKEITLMDAALSELPVELDVELARFSLTMTELGAMTPGTVLPLRIAAGSPVFVRAGERRIARAELVEIDGEIAARILGLIP
jgi:type III secretion protein Q